MTPKKYARYDRKHRHHHSNNQRLRRGASRSSFIRGSNHSSHQSCRCNRRNCKNSWKVPNHVPHQSDCSQILCLKKKIARKPLVGDPDGQSQRLLQKHWQNEPCHRSKRATQVSDCVHSRQSLGWNTLRHSDPSLAT